MYKCKQNLNPPATMNSEMKILFNSLYAEQILFSIPFHTV